jgi:predicted metal-binding membrane protein
MGTERTSPLAPRFAAMTGGRAAAMAAALTATLGLASASGVISVRQMNGMGMGVATRLGSFASFAGLWVAMMAAMMLPGAAPAVLGRAQAGGVRAVPAFAGRGALSRCLAESQRSGKQSETIAGGSEEPCSVRS